MLVSRTRFVFRALAFDVVTFKYLKKTKFDYFKNVTSFRSETKNTFPCFASALLDLQNKLAKM